MVKYDVMNHLSAKLGFWAAVGCVVTFVVFTVCFVAILATSPLFIWTNMADFVAYAEQNGRFFQYLAQFSMLVFGILFVALLNSIHEGAPPDKKILSRNSLSFGLIFAALTGINYFVQISAVRINLAKGHLAGLEQFLQANPDSAISAINMLGFTVFFGLSSLFVAPVFGDGEAGRLEQVIKVAFLLNGIFLLVAGVSFLFQWLVPLFLTINIGMGGAVMVATGALALWFRRRM